MIFPATAPSDPDGRDVGGTVAGTAGLVVVVAGSVVRGDVVGSAAVVDTVRRGARVDVVVDDAVVDGARVTDA
jgi:hypothetical protein